MSGSPPFGAEPGPPDAAEREVLLLASRLAALAVEHGRLDERLIHRERLEIAGELRHAVAEGQFELHYQPQVDQGGALLGSEALVRWRHAVTGMIPPLKFIPVAEEMGLILPIGEWVLREACRQNKRWQDAGLPGARVAVNVSALQFAQPDFVDRVRAPC